MNKKSYTVTAHRNGSRPFHITYKAYTSQHAGALFLAEMSKQKVSVVIEKATGEIEYFSPEKFQDIVILDRIQSIRNNP